MKFRGLVSAVVVLLALGGLLYWSGHHKAAPHQNPGQPTIVSIPRSRVTSLTLRARGAQPVVLAHTTSGKWQIQSPGPWPASYGTVSEMLSSLSHLTAQRVIEENGADLSAYGLDNPSFVLDIAEMGKPSQQLSFGDRAPTGNGIYLLVSGDPRVFLVPAWVRNTFDKPVDQLRDRSLLAVDPATVVHIQLIRPGETVEFGRAHNGWQFEQPQPWRADSSQVDALLNQVTDAQWDPSTDPAKAGAAFAHGTPLATVRLIGSRGTQTLEVRADRGDDYALSSVAQGPWKISPVLAQTLSRPVDSFRNKQLFDFAYADPDKIEVHNGATALFLTRSGTNWTSVGQKMNSGSVEDLVTALRDLAASKFVDTGFTSPTLRITVTSGGHQVESVAIQPTKDGAIAKRDGSPSLYFLDANTFSLLTGAISGIHPAAPAPARK